MKGKVGKSSTVEMPVKKGDPDIVVDKPFKHGGKVEGKKAHKRADKYARGGTDKKWIQGAEIKKGAFTAKAKHAGKTVHELAEEKKNASGKTGKQARLALTFEKMARKK